MYLIGNGKLITNDPSAPFIECGAVAVEGTRITEVGAFNELRTRFPDAVVIDACGGVIMPGLIDLHAHSRYTFLRGRDFPNLPEDESIRIINGMLRSLNRQLKADDCIAAAFAQAILCIKNGVTALFDQHNSREFVSGSLASIASVYRHCGIRACLSFGVSERHGSKGLETAIRENIEFYDYCRSLDIDTLVPSFCLDAPSQMSDAALQACIEANDGGMPFCFHDSQTVDSVIESLKRSGMRPMIRLSRIEGLFPNSLAAGCLHANEEEIDALIEGGCSVAVSPFLAMVTGKASGASFSCAAASNTVGSFGICSDSLGSNMFSAVRTAELITRMQPNKSGSRRVCDADLLLRGNPRIASKVFRTRLGVLESGAAADIIIMRSEPFSAQDSSERCIRSIIDGGAVCEMTMVNGKVLMMDGKLCHIDESRHIINYNKRCKVVQRFLENSPNQPGI